MHRQSFAQGFQSFTLGFTLARNIKVQALCNKPVTLPPDYGAKLLHELSVSEETAKSIYPIAWRLNAEYRPVTKCSN